MTTIQPAGMEWAYPAIEQDWHEGRDTWREVSEEFYGEALEVLPPVYVSGGFMVGEPHSHNAAGDEIRALFAEVGGKFYARMCARRDANTATLALRHTLNGKVAA